MKDKYNNKRRNRAGMARSNAGGGQTGNGVTREIRKMKITRYLVLLVITCLLCMGYALFGGNNTPQNESNNTDVSASAENQQVDAANEDNESTSDNASTKADNSGADDKVEILYTFKSQKYLDQHFEKHGEDFDYTNAQEYLEGANRVIQNPNALHKLEAEDGDDVYYLEETNEFVIVSTKGFIRTYFCPSAGLDYYNRQ